MATPLFPPTDTGLCDDGVTDTLCGQLQEACGLSHQTCTFTQNVTLNGVQYPAGISLYFPLAAWNQGSWPGFVSA